MRTVGPTRWIEPLVVGAAVSLIGALAAIAEIVPTGSAEVEPVQVWNKNCSGCHVSQQRKNFDPSTRCHTERSSGWVWWPIRGDASSSATCCRRSPIRATWWRSAIEKGAMRELELLRRQIPDYPGLAELLVESLGEGGRR